MPTLNSDKIFISPQTEAKYRALLRSGKNLFSKDDLKSIRTAFKMIHQIEPVTAYDENTLDFCLDLALIISAEIGIQQSPVVISCLLYYYVLSGHLSIEQIREVFGEKVAVITQELSKISAISVKDSKQQAENFRTMLLSIVTDVRVIIIKLAERLQLMRIIDRFPEKDALQFASDTFYLFAPLAHRLGLYTLKSELEDLSLRLINPEAYRSISEKLEATAQWRNRFIRDFIAPIKDSLTQQGFAFEIKGRLKSVYSIYNKMIKQGVDFEEVYDIFAIRIILESLPEKEKSDCWQVYSTVTDFYTPNPMRMRDWISIPKSNGYESLHATVMGHNGRWVEVQIRTRRMNEVAEKGLAAHWKYKAGTSKADEMEQLLLAIREALETPDAENASEVFDTLNLHLHSKEVFVFTPKGDLRKLPIGATLLDFAFDIHSKVGATCLSGKVNGKNVSLKYVLQNGDRVEVITAKNQQPKLGWLKMVITSKAKNHIKNLLKEEERKKVEQGREILLRRLKNWKITFDDTCIAKIEKCFKLKTHTDVFIKIAEDAIDLVQIKEILSAKEEVQRTPEKIDEASVGNLVRRKEREADMLIIDQMPGRWSYQLAKCCNPIVGDDIFGFVTINEGIKIHRKNCPNAKYLNDKFKYRVIPAQWTSSAADNLSEASIMVVGTDDVGIVNRISEKLSRELKVNLRSIEVKTTDGLFEGVLSIYVKDNRHLENVIRKLHEVQGVTQVSRGSFRQREE